MRMRFLLILVLGAMALSGCDTGLKQMGPTEYGIIFRKLPPAIGGGVSSKVTYPGQTVVVWPWDAIYRFDTSVQDITWGVATNTATADASEKETARPNDPGYVNTRALDGNEVALAVIVRYQVTTDAERLRHMVESVATSDSEVKELVVSVARADIRTYLNELKTSQFLDKSELYTAVDKAKDSMASRLRPFGIDVLSVDLRDFRFERALETGDVDTRYGDNLREIQKLQQDREREISRIETVKAKKQQEYNEALAEVNRKVAEARGIKDQSKYRGDAYYTTRMNEALGIKARGEAEVKGLIQQIEALNGPGGHELLKLELVKQLLKSDPKFIVLGEGSGAQNMDVRRTDTNQLLGQLGLLEGMRSGSNSSAGAQGGINNQGEGARAALKRPETESKKEETNGKQE